jgi:predicted transcriptional regulator
MKSTEKKEPVQRDKTWILPDNDLSKEEIVCGIRLAEEGPFFTVQESMEHFDLWLKANEKK